MQVDCPVARVALQVGGPGLEVHLKGGLSVGQSKIEFTAAVSGLSCISIRDPRNHLESSCRPPTLPSPTGQIAGFEDAKLVAVKALSQEARITK